MAGILRGEIRWAELNPVQGHEQGVRRPVVILSHTIFNQKSGTVIASAITSRPQRVGFPLAVEILSCKLPKQSWVKIGQIRTLSVQRIGSKIGELSDEELSRIIDGLNEIIA